MTIFLKNLPALFYLRKQCKKNPAGDDVSRPAPIYPYTHTNKRHEYQPQSLIPFIRKGNYYLTLNKRHEIS